MTELAPVRDRCDESTPPYRIDAPLHDLLMAGTSRSLLERGDRIECLPTPVPQPPRSEEDELSYFAYQKSQAFRAVRCWAVPYLRSRWYSRELRPLMACLFTEWKCNLDCHYCWAHSKHVKGMSEDTAKRSIDWLHSTGCRVLAIMGGEPLLRPDFIHKVVYYAARNGFYVYLPTNGRLMRPELIDRLGDAGVATVNLAVDCVDERPGLPKALTPIRPYFDYLLKMQRRYGYCVFLNINISRTNIDEVKRLTEIARDSNVITCYHLTETPMIEQSEFKHLQSNSTFLRPEDYGKVDDLLDYLIDRSRQGYKMLNPVDGLARMKDTMRGQVRPWPCRAGRSMLVVRVDGSLAPCFPMYSAKYDWGVVGNQKLEAGQLEEMRKTCNRHCFSTTQSILGYCYNDARVLRWIGKQALNGFRGVTGSF